MCRFLELKLLFFPYNGSIQILCTMEDMWMKNQWKSVVLCAALTVSLAATPVSAASISAAQEEPALVGASVTAFDDVEDANKYYFRPVYWARQEGITSGATATEFRPGETCTRGQIVTFLWKMKNQPVPATANTFRDISSGAFYEIPAAWAAENGITSGMTKETFAPNAACTRAQIVTFLWNLAGKPAASGEKTFSDVKDHAFYAAAVKWAAAKGIVKGVGGGNFGPNEACTRAQTVSILYKYVADGRELAVDLPEITNSTSEGVIGVEDCYGVNYSDAKGKKYVAYGFTLKNDLGFDDQFPQVRITMKDAGGNVLKTVTETLRIIRNGDTLARCEAVEVGGDASSFAFDVISSGQETDGSDFMRASAFTSSSVSETIQDGTNWSKLTCHVTNTSGKDISTALVTILATKDGKIVDGCSTHIKSLAARATQPVTTYCSHPMQPHDSFRVIVEDQSFA